ncbi:major facilitator superfamily protein related folate carrier activity [Klebsormidium nitens]|uniref:Major facilitator superfamily protein related folate carrier activity n=1 Tax=Klebsormidium nitens TaxID=105231 RepID=A0A1Y1I997_KLENI|nr:major facilitator superfamily protein related folate carrier activity [Klebsormidium nitens]|eukprot:GAQ87544.1 major facilitator superfamily protein related folate carrier activity [Klebsormidium nitens]
MQLRRDSRKSGLLLKLVAMEEDSATAQSVMRGIDRAAERLGLDRPNLGLDKQLVRILLLLGAFVFLLQIRPQQPNAVQYLKPHSTYSRSAYLAAHAPAPAPVEAYRKGYALNVADDHAYTATDGVVYMPDGFYTQENAQYTTANWTSVRLTEGDVNNTADPQLYWTERWGAFNYTLPYLENGLYEVSIDMAESWWQEPKDRGFYIQVQDNPVEGPIDLVERAGGRLTAYTYTAKTAVADHHLLIQFLHAAPEDGFKDDGGLANAIRVTQLAPEAIAAPPPANTTGGFLQRIAPPQVVDSRNFPVSIFTVLLFAVAAAPAAEYFSYKSVIIVGAVAAIFTQVIVMYGTSFLTDALMQLTYGLSFAGALAFAAFLYLLVAEGNFQLITSVAIGAHLAAVIMATALTSILRGIGIPTLLLLFISLAPVTLAAILACVFPREPNSHLSSNTSLLKLTDPEEGPLAALKETYQNRNLRLLSVWWVLGGAVGPLIQAHASELFSHYSVEDGGPAYSGYRAQSLVYVLANAAALLAVLSLIRFNRLAASAGGGVYIVGSLVIGVCSLLLSRTGSTGFAYFLFTVVTALSWALYALVVAQSALALRTARYILLFATNTAGQLVVQGIFQIYTARSDHALVPGKFLAFGVFELVVAVVFGVLYYLLTRETGRVAIVVLPDQDQAYSRINEDQPQKFGMDLELSRDFPVQTALNDHVEQIKRISGMDEDEYDGEEEHTGPQDSSHV